MDKIKVKGSLQFNGYDTLTGLGGDISIGGHLQLVGCSQVTGLPDWLMQLRKTSSGSVRTIDLRDSNLSLELIMQLRSVFFDVSSNEVDVFWPKKPEFITLDHAIKFWMRLATSDVDMPYMADLDSYQYKTIRLFLGKLLNSADYKNEKTRCLLANRIIKILSSFKEMNATSISNAISIMDEGLGGCADRSSLALDELEMYPILLEAETNAHEKNDIAELKEFGKKMMILEKIDKFSSLYISRLMGQNREGFQRIGTDDAEIRLFFRISLCDKFGILGLTHDSLYHSGLDNEDAEVEKVYNDIMKDCADGTELDNFFKKWEPLQKYNRYQNTPEFNSLKSLEINKFDVCPIFCYSSDEMVMIDDTQISFDAL